jgi:hypothetical protein
LKKVHARAGLFGLILQLSLKQAANEIEQKISDNPPRPRKQELVELK